MVEIDTPKTPKEPTPEDVHAASMRSSLQHQRNNLLQEKAMLQRGPERIAHIDEHLALIEADLARYGYVVPEEGKRGQ